MTITDHGRPVAILMPIQKTSTEEILRMLDATGRISWSGGRGKPAGVSAGARIEGSPAEDAVVEDRR